MSARTFVIQGEVCDPGTYIWHAGLTLAAALRLAGGTTPIGSQRRATVRRGQRVLRLRPADAILPGDQITVPRRLF